MSEKTATITVKGEPGKPCELHTFYGVGVPGTIPTCRLNKLPCPGFLVRNPDGTGCPAKAKE